MSELRRLDECLSVGPEGLRIEGCGARDLAERFGTPLYVMSEDQLRRNAARFEREFGSRWPGEVLLLPSLKANPALALRHILNDAGTGCDVFGPGELEAALGTGTPPDRISLNGPMKDEALLERAIRAGVRITLDSRPELTRTIAAAQRAGRQAKVRLRVRPDLSGFDEPSEMSASGASVRRALDRYKAGIPTEDVLGIAASEAFGPALDLTGLHLHLGRHSADPATWGGAVDALLAILAQLRVRWDGWTPRELDLGGGFPVPRDPFGRLLPQRSDAPEHSPGAEAFAEAICLRLVSGLERLGIDAAAIRLELEPGRSLYGDAGVHLATVGNVKRQHEPTELTWVEVDSSDAYLADVNLEFSRWSVLAVDRPDAAPVLRADVTGRTCALDVIVPDARVPEIEPGDVLAFLDTGAYQDAGGHNFNALGRPGTVLVTGTAAAMIRRHETAADVFARDLVPERLQEAGSSRADDPAWESWRVRALDHFAITCADLDRSLAFYRDLLGVELRARGEASGSSEFAIAGMADADVRWADLQLPHGQVIELIEYGGAGQAASAAPAADRPRAGSTHLALRVEDADDVFARLQEAGVPTRTAPMTIEGPGAWHGARAFYATDPDGVTVELIQQPR